MPGRRGREVARLLPHFRGNPTVFAPMHRVHGSEDHGLWTLDGRAQLLEYPRHDRIRQARAAFWRFFQAPPFSPDNASTYQSFQDDCIRPVSSDPSSRHSRARTASHSRKRHFTPVSARFTQTRSGEATPKTDNLDVGPGPSVVDEALVEAGEPRRKAGDRGTEGIETSGKINGPPSTYIELTSRRLTQIHPSRLASSISPGMGPSQLPRKKSTPPTAATTASKP